MQYLLVGNCLSFKENHAPLTKSPTHSLTMPPSTTHLRGNKRSQRKSSNASDGAIATTASVNAVGWEDIPVTLGGDDGDGDVGMEVDVNVDADERDDFHGSNSTNSKKKTKNTKRNHYDNEQLGKQATMDLPAQPGEEIGMMYGGSIQVLRGDQYQVILQKDDSTIQKRIVLLKPSAEDQDHTKKVQAPVATATPKKKKSKETKEPMEGSASVDRPQKKVIEPVPSKKSKKRPAPQESSHTPPTPPMEKLSSSFLPDEEEDPIPKEDKHTNDDDENDDEDAWRQLQLSWSHASGGAVLDPILCRSLLRLGFHQPTPIQAKDVGISITHFAISLATTTP
jgi:hypothetical protein